MTLYNLYMFITKLLGVIRHDTLKFVHVYYKVTWCRLYDPLQFVHVYYKVTWCRRHDPLKFVHVYYKVTWCHPS